MPKAELKTELEVQKETVKKSQTDAARVDVCKDCNMRGMGGSYIYDVATGKRKRVAGPGIKNKSGGVQ